VKVCIKDCVVAYSVITVHYVCMKMNKRLQLHVVAYSVQMHYVFLAK